MVPTGNEPPPQLASPVGQTAREHHPKNVTHKFQIGKWPVSQPPIFNFPTSALHDLGLKTSQPEAALLFKLRRAKAPDID